MRDASCCRSPATTRCVSIRPCSNFCPAMGKRPQRHRRSPDERLRLMLVCAHPAIAEAVRMPLMLQLVLGLQVAEIAPAMLQSPAALAQRLVRAKQQIRAAGLRFEAPEPAELAPRLQPVLECIYGAFGMATATVAGAESRISDLRREALWLGQIVCQLSPHSPEALGLLALMQFCQARQAAGRSAAGKL